MIHLILLTDFTETYATELLRGILDYSQGHGPWVVSRMPTSYRVEHGVDGVVEWAKQWKADAIIGQFDTHDDVDAFARNGIIAVAQDFMQRFDSIPNITGDYLAQGMHAADYFINKGFRNFAFYGYANAVWSKERCQGFAEQLMSHGHKPPYIYEKQSLENLWFYDPESLADWLRSLPHSTAILACDDTRANVILEVCRMIGIKVPSDIAVLGVDNDEITCTLTYPNLSSVCLDVRSAGYKTAQRIKQVLNGGQHRDDDIMVDYIGIMERQSTDILMTANKHILAVLSYIHQHYADKLTVEQLLKLVPMSRRLLEKTFKMETGTSIHQYIMDLRLERMKQLLMSTDMPIADLALATGLSDAKNVARLFNQREGITPLGYRQLHGGYKKKH